MKRNIFRKKGNRRAPRRNRKNEIVEERRDRKRAEKSHIFQLTQPKRRKEKQKRVDPRTVIWVKLGALAMCFLLGLIVVDHFARHYIVENPQFALSLEKIDYTSDGVLSRKEMIDYLELREKTSLFKLDLPMIRKALLDLPEIHDAQVERHLPDKLRISIHERFPIAWISQENRKIMPYNTSKPELGTRGVLVDVNGVLLECQSLEDRYMTLPVIVVRDLGAWRPGQVIEDAQTQAAIDLVIASQDLLLSEAISLKSVWPEKDWKLIAEFDSGAIVTFGLEDVARQVSHFSKIVRNSRESGEGPILTANMIAPLSDTLRDEFQYHVTYQKKPVWPDKPEQQEIQRAIPVPETDLQPNEPPSSPRRVLSPSRPRMIQRSIPKEQSTSNGEVRARRVG